VAQVDDVPLLGDLRTSAVIGASLDSGRRPASSMTDRPRPSFERRPAKSDAVPKTGMPFTVTSKEERRRESAVPVRRFSRSRRPHVCPEGRAFFGHCKVTVAVPREFVTGCVRENERLLGLERRVPGADVPSTRSRSTGTTVGEDRLPRSHRTGRSALTASTTESPRPDVPRTS
jgi:hypothetical protein